MFDAEELLRKFARDSALSCLHNWKEPIPDVVRKWLETGDKQYQSAAESAAEESAARSAAWSAADSAAYSAAESAAYSAARSAAWSAARSAAEESAAEESAAWSAARSAAWSAADKKLNALLVREMDRTHGDLVCQAR